VIRRDLKIRSRRKVGRLLLKRLENETNDL
jgi:hypothetical protein